MLFEGSHDISQGSAVMSLLSRWSLYVRWELFMLFVESLCLSRLCRYVIAQPMVIVSLVWSVFDIGAMASPNSSSSFGS
jgi:hypothetical protein